MLLYSVAKRVIGARILLLTCCTLAPVVATVDLVNRRRGVGPARATDRIEQTKAKEDGEEG